MFNIELEQENLAKALAYLAPTVGANIGGYGDNCISMKTTLNNTVKMYTTNTIETATVEVVVNSLMTGTEEQSPYVDFTRLRKIVRSIPSNEMVYLEGDKDLEISFGGSSGKLILTGATINMPPAPAIPANPARTITVPREFIAKALKNACVIIPNGHTVAPIFECIKINADAMNVDIVAIDAKYNRTFLQSGKANNNNPQEEIIIEAEKLMKVIKIFEEYEELNFMIDNGQVIIQGSDPLANSSGMLSDQTYYCRLINGQFPVSIKDNFKNSTPDFAEVNKEGFQEIISRFKAIEDKGTIDSDVFTFKANGSDLVLSKKTGYGSIEETIQLENPITASYDVEFRYSLINEILKTIKKSTFEIGQLTQVPNNFVLKAAGQDEIMYSIPTMVSNAITNIP